MKNKIAFASAFLAAASFSTAEIVINDFLSFEGFVDSSYSHTDLNNLTEVDGNQNSFGIDQVEISWLFDFDTVTAQVDLEYEDNDGQDTEVEQAFVTYHLDNGGAITAGRYASMLGFEAFEPTGLYQYSTAYSIVGLADVSALPGYAQGVKYTQESDTTFFGISVQDEAYDLGSDRLGGNQGDSSHAVEVAGALDMGNGLAFFLGGVYEDGETADSQVINAYATFETGAWIFAAEVNFGELENGAASSAALGEVADLLDVADALALDAGYAGDFSTAGDEDVLQFLLMANFAYSDQASVTGRLSYSEHESSVSASFDGTGAIAAGSYAADVDAEFFKATVAHNYAFTDNLLLVTELSYVEGDIDVEGLGDDRFDGLEAAVELLFTF